MRSIVVIPTIRDLSFLDEWREQFEDLDIFFIVCEDRDKITLKIPNGFEGIVYSHKEIEKELGKNFWIIPFGTSAIRSFGFWKAWQKKPDMIVSLDDDCYPDQADYLFQHSQLLNSYVTLDWVKTANMFTRGFPYSIREKAEVVINHGLWSFIPDLDAPTQLLNPDVRFKPVYKSHIIPRGNYYAHCGMNFVFKTKVTPLMYFGLQGPSWPFDRMDDIWAGIIAKKIIDHLGYAVTSGKPSVEHRKQSNVFKNLKKETPGIIVNEYFWKNIDSIKLTSDNLIDCYMEIAEKMNIKDENQQYWSKLKEAMLIWAGLFS